MPPLLPALLALQTAALPPAAAPAPPGDVVVRARTEAEIERSVQLLTQTFRGGQIARWHTALCPHVIGVDYRHAAFVETRIAALGAGLGLSRPSAKCSPNVLIIATEDADALTQGLVKRHPGLFRDPKYGIAHGQELTRLLTPRPVRWLASSHTVDYTGMEMIDGGVSNQRLGSRIALPTREDVLVSMLLVDTNKLQSLKWQQLADYLAMAALAQPRLDTDYGADTIMSLFAARDRGESGPAGLTPSDRALLDGLYHTDPAVTATMQRGEITHRVYHAPATP